MAGIPVQIHLSSPLMAGQVGIPWTRYDVVRPGAQAGLALGKPHRATPLGLDPED